MKKIVQLINSRVVVVVVVVMVVVLVVGKVVRVLCVWESERTAFTHHSHRTSQLASYSVLHRASHHTTPNRTAPHRTAPCTAAHRLEVSEVFFEEARVECRTHQNQLDARPPLKQLFLWWCIDVTQTAKTR
jgi:hypothetical protein